MIQALLQEDLLASSGEGQPENPFLSEDFEVVAELYRNPARVRAAHIARSQQADAKMCVKLAVFWWLREAIEGMPAAGRAPLVTELARAAAKLNEQAGAMRLPVPNMIWELRRAPANARLALYAAVFVLIAMFAIASSIRREDGSTPFFDLLAFVAQSLGMKDTDGNRMWRYKIMGFTMLHFLAPFMGLCPRREARVQSLVSESVLAQAVPRGPASDDNDAAANGPGMKAKQD